LSGVVLPTYRGLLGAPNLISRVPLLADLIGYITQIQSVLQRGNLDLPGLGQREGMWQLDALRIDAEKGVPLLMVDGRGRNWGYWVVESLRERESAFFADGAAQKVEFDVAISYYGEEAPESIIPGSGFTDVLRGILGL